MNSTIPVGNRFADYFVICGLDLNSGLEPDNFSGDNLQCTPLDRSYKARVLGHYPENVPWNPFDNNAVCMLCLPHGLQFRTQKHCLDPQFHSFVITREDGTRSYGFSYVFYEEIRNKKLCSAMQTLQAMHLTELSSSRMGNGNRRNKQGQIGHEGHNTRSLPRHFKLSTHQQGAAQSYYDVTKDVLYATKSIALICQLAYVHAAQKFLTGLYRCHTSHSSDKLSIESYVYNLLYEVPLPHPGRSIRFACYCGGSEVYENLVLQRPSSIEELPLFDFSLQELFRLLGLDCVIQLFTCVLLENQILLCSSDYQRLMLVAESITCLLFPFFWQHVYVPILPSSLQHFLDAPVPFIMGLHSNASHFRVASQGNLCYVDIDTRNIQLPEELPNFPQRNEFVAELSELLKRYNIPTGPLISSSIQILNAPNIMTSSCTLPSGFHPRRKHSWSHDSDSGVSDSSSINGSHSSISGSPQSDALQKVVAIVRKTGVNLDGIDGNLNLSIDDNDQDLTPQEQYEQELKFNNAVREIFLNRFVYIFSAYEHFIIQPNQAKKLMVSMHAADKEQWLSNRDSMQNFDKATFLSDQPELHLPFLSRFIESQMFATLIDNKIMSNWSEVDPNLRVFDRRIQLLRKHFGDGLVRTPSYEPCTTIRETQLLLDKRLASQDVYVPLPQEILQQSSSPVDPPPRSRSSSNFPLLDTNALNKEFSHRARKRSNAQLRQRRERNQHRSHTVTNNCNSTSTNSTHQDLDELQNKENKTLPNSNSSSLNSVGSLRQPKLSDVSPAVIAQTNWSFVEKLLRDVKSKTKRMLVEKMGTEAVELGHGEVSIVGVEENTLIASLCDLLERIWSHGLQNKQGKSALWTHLTSFQDLQDCNDASKPIDPSFLTPVTTSPTKFGLPELFLSIKSGNIFEIASYITSNFDLSSVASDPDATPSPPRGRERQKTPERRSPMERKSLGNTDQPILRPIPVSLTFDMRNVQAMSDIKTHIGYARAWVRLSLEKKLLSRHLRTLLADTALLRSLYKRYAFLRCEEEKEQFLYHLLTLNAVDYFCFTNTYPNTKLPYRVVIFPSRKASAATTTANSWVTISGTLNETSPVPIPRGALEFVFHHKNLGVLTTLSIGHDNTGMSPKWMIEHIVVRNEVTGHTYKFPCGRWLGRGIDDGSTERLLVGELVPRHVDSDELVESCRTPPRCRSPSIPRRPSELRPTAAEIQHMLGDAVNNIVKFFYKRKHERDRSTLTVLLCGEMGLVYCLEQAFLHGFRSARWLGRNLYLWDYFVRVKEQFEITLSEMEHHEVLSESLSEDERQEALEHGAILRCYCHLVDQIITSSHTLGKDGKFQLFICLCAREHLLHHMLPHLASCRVTVEMYEEQSFLRNETHFTYLKQILESLDEFDIVLENSLTKGIEL